jgi:hypothetical protein
MVEIFGGPPLVGAEGIDSLMFNSLFQNSRHGEELACNQPALPLL